MRIPLTEQPTVRGIFAEHTMPDLPKSKRCTRCRRVKPASEFWTNVYDHNRRTLRSSCKPCEKARRKAIRDADFMTFEGFARRTMKAKLTRARWHAKKRHSVPEAEFKIDPAWFIAQWKAQKGKCYYTRVPLQREASPAKVSVDRIDSELGYTPENCVLACYAVNLMKHRAPLSEFVWWCRKVSRHCRVAPSVPTGRKTKFFR